LEQWWCINNSVKMKTIKEATVIELKAECFDIIEKINLLEQNIKIIKKELQHRKQGAKNDIRTETKKI